MSVPTVLLVPDCGPEVGIGHLERALALADELSEIQVSVSVPPDELVLARVHGRGLTTTVGTEDVVRGAETAVARVRPDVVVLDGYRFPMELQSTLREMSRVVLVDDLSLPCDVDLLVNPAPGADVIPVPQGAREVLAGPAYALISRAYLEAREARDRQPPAGKPRVLAVSGGSDIGGLMGSLVETLVALLDRASVDAVIGPHGRAIDPVDGVTVHEGPAGLDHLLAVATIYVGGAGTTSIQAAAVGVPQVIVPLVDNQVAQADALGRAGAAVVVEHRGAPMSDVATRIAAATADLLSDAGRAREMGANGARLVDGRGAARVADAVRRLATMGAAA